MRSATWEGRLESRISMKISGRKSFCFSALFHALFLVTGVQSLSSKYGYRPSLKLSSQSPVALNGKSKDSGSELFRGKRPYVPSELSAEEYQKIKKKEADEQKSMNFGAWGPRFKRTDTPDGEWMIMPTLWTNGVNARARPTQPFAEDTNASFGKRLMAGFASVVKHNASAFIMGYIIVDVLATALAMLRATELSMRQAVWMILKVALFKRKSFYVTTFMKAQAVKMTLAAAMTPAMNIVLERMNRRKLWTKRRTVLSMAVACAGGLVLWAALLRLASMLV